MLIINADDWGPLAEPAEADYLMSDEFAELLERLQAGSYALVRSLSSDSLSSDLRHLVKFSVL
jgi:hypothetical protein